MSGAQCLAHDSCSVQACQGHRDVVADGGGGEAMMVMAVMVVMMIVMVVKGSWLRLPFPTGVPSRPRPKGKGAASDDPTKVTMGTGEWGAVSQRSPSPGPRPRASLLLGSPVSADHPRCADGGSPSRQGSGEPPAWPCEGHMVSPVSSEPRPRLAPPAPGRAPGTRLG